MRQKYIYVLSGSSPLSLEPDHPESLSLLGHGHLQLGQPSLRRGGLRVERWVSEWRRENSFDSDRCVSVIVHRGVVHLLDGPGSRSHLVGEDLVAAPDLLLELVHRDAAGACEAERERRDPGAQHLLPLFVFPFLRDRLEPETSLPRRYLRVPRVGWVGCDRRGRGVSSA